MFVRVSTLPLMWRLKAVQTFVPQMLLIW